MSDPSATYEPLVPNTALAWNRRAPLNAAASYGRSILSTHPGKREKKPKQRAKLPPVAGPVFLPFPQWLLPQKLGGKIWLLKGVVTREPGRVMQGETLRLTWGSRSPAARPKGLRRTAKLHFAAWIRSLLKALALIP